MDAILMKKSIIALEFSVVYPIEDRSYHQSLTYKSKKNSETEGQIHLYYHILKVNTFESCFAALFFLNFSVRLS